MFISSTGYNTRKVIDRKNSEGEKNQINGLYYIQFPSNWSYARVGLMGSYLISLTSIEMMFMSAEIERDRQKKSPYFMPRTMIYHKTPETKLFFFFFPTYKGSFCHFDYGYQGDISNGLGDTWLV